MMTSDDTDNNNDDNNINYIALILPKLEMDLHKIQVKISFTEYMGMKINEKH